MSQNQFVLPGDVIVTGDYTPEQNVILDGDRICLLYTSPSPRDS